MPFTTPPTAVFGSVVQAQHRNVLRQNDLWFNALVPAPGAANQVPALTSAIAGAWSKLQTASFQAGAVGTAELAGGAITTAKIADDLFGIPDFSTSVGQSFVPVGLVLMVQTEAEIPPGGAWTRETALNGRMIVNAGTLFGVTFDEGDNRGSSWSHTHPFDVTSGAPTVTQGSMDNSPEGSDGSIASDTHPHAFSGTTGSTQWLIPCRAFVFMRFDP